MSVSKTTSQTLSALEQLPVEVQTRIYLQTNSSDLFCSLAFVSLTITRVVQDISDNWCVDEQSANLLREKMVTTYEPKKILTWFDFDCKALPKIYVKSVEQVGVEKLYLDHISDHISRETLGGIFALFFRSQLLDISHSNIDATTFSQVVLPPHLQEVSVRDTKITRLHAFKQLNNLRKLNVTKCSAIDAEGIQDIVDIMQN